ncbi:MAG: hypothetical protein ACKVT0_03975, partial [Planctomycetaceae bacterium]
MIGPERQIFEVAGSEEGPSGNGFTAGSNSNFSMGAIEIAMGSTVEFKNQIANAAGTGSCAEALYVYDLILESGSVAVLDKCKVYYERLFDDGAEITSLGCGGLGPTRLTGTPPNLAIDAAQPDSPEHSLPEGWRSVVLTNLPKSASSKEFLVSVESEDDPPLPPLSVLEVARHPSGGVEVFFDQPVPPGHWTILT